MLDKLIISNFQSHRDSTLEFHPGVNVIVGSTDSGKTAVIRALRWALYNKPGGTAFRSNWGGDTEVVLVTKDAIVQRQRSDKHNIYILNNVEFKAFGNDVPEPIQEALNMDETNIQQQLDSPFLISLPPGQVAAYFNKIARLDQIDLGIKNAQSNITGIASDIKADEQRIEELDANLKTYEYLDWAEADIEVLERRQSELIQTAQTRHKLSALIEDIKTNERQMDEASTLLKFKDPVTRLFEQITIRDQAIQDHAKLDGLLMEIVEIDDASQELDQYLSLSDGIDELYNKVKARGKAEKTVKNLRLLIIEIDLAGAAHKKVQREIKESEQIFHEHMPDICPLCETDLKQTK